MKRPIRKFLQVFLAIGCASAVLFPIFDATTSEAMSAADATTIYSRECVSCHGRDGRGRTRKGRQTHARDMTRAEWQDDVSDERLFNSISNGRGKMPAFRKKISENDIEALVAHVRRMRR